MIESGSCAGSKRIVEVPVELQPALEALGLLESGVKRLR
jgi:hypothetical protein